jgi:hypothetical protein
VIRELDAAGRVGHTSSMRFAVLLLLFSGAVRAWDPADAASVDARIEALRTAWAGKDRAAIANDKLERARQRAKPAWVSRVAFRIDDGLRRLYLGVGSARLPPAALRPIVLDDGPATPEGAIALDWYLDEAASTLYALTVEEKR